MANQPPPTARPFFRIGSVSRPAPPPAVQPLARPTFTVPFRPPPPQPQPTQLQEPTPPPPPPPPAASAAIPTTFAPSSSKPTSPAPKSTPSSTMAPLVTSSSSVPSSPIKPNIISTSSSSLPTSPPPKTGKTAPPTATELAAAATRVPTPTPSPKIIKPSAPLPYPLTLLLPSQLKPVPEAETKIPLQVFEQKNVTKDAVVAKEKRAHEKKFSDSESGGVRVITIAGENKGALMQLGLSHEKNKNSKDEGKWKMMEKNQQPLGTASAVPMRAFINSNVQGVNNSILRNCSCTHHDPGVHVTLSTKPTASARGIHLKDHANGHHN